MTFSIDGKPALKRSLYSLMRPDERILILFTPETELLLPKLSAFQKALLLLCDGKHRVDEIGALLAQQGFSHSSEDILRELDRFSEHLLLEDARDGANEALLSEKHTEQYDRQLLYFAAQHSEGRQYALQTQRNLQETHVLIIGVGCFGSHVLYGLSAAGIGKISLVDFDVVELSNLNRQCMYSEQDVGRSKIDALKERSNSLNRSTEYVFMEKRVNSLADFVRLIEHSSPNLVVLTADSPRDKIFSWLNEASYRTGVPALFTIGVTPASVRIGPLVIPGQTSCYDCSMPEISFRYDDPLIQLINTRHTQGVIAPHAMMAGGIMTLEILKHLSGFAPCRLYNTRILLDVFRYETRFHTIKSRRHCPFCGEKDVNRALRILLND